MENFAGSIFSWDNFPEGDYSEVVVQGTKVQRVIVLGEFHEWRLPGGAVIQEELFRSNCLAVIVLGDFIRNIFSGCIVQGESFRSNCPGSNCTGGSSLETILRGQLSMGKPPDSPRKLS